MNAAAAKLHQSCPTLCDPIDGSPLLCPWDSPGKNTRVGHHFLLHCKKVKSESEVAQSCRLFATPWTAAHQAPLSMGFSWQEYWSGLPFPSLGALPHPGIEPRSPAIPSFRRLFRPWDQTGVSCVCFFNVTGCFPSSSTL